MGQPGGSVLRSKPSEVSTPAMPDDPGESSVIAAILRARPATRGVLVDVGDDAAVLEGGEVLTSDLLVEGVHFDERLSPGDVGWKAVAVNVSDLGAMGARPAWAVLGLSLPRPLDMDWVAAFADGLGAALARWELSLVGGDTTRSSGPVVVSLTVGGRCVRPILRSGGEPGDELWVTGTLGAAAAGFLRGGPGAAWLRRPEPPVAFGVALGGSGLVHAMMDLSDGLATDLPRLASASGLAAEIDLEALPLDPATAEAHEPLQEGMAWGEDYQLLLAAPPAAGSALQALARSAGVRLSRIGRLTAGSGCRTSDGTWPRPGFSHFEEGA